MNKKRPYELNIAMVFQNYALFPHPSVERNIAFGLELRKTPSSEIPGRVKKAMEMVRLDPAISAKYNLKAFISAQVKGQVVSGDVWIAQLWNGDTAQASKDEPKIAYCLPKEGAALWTDSLVIPKGAQHKRAAHAFMDFRPSRCPSPPRRK